MLKKNDVVRLTVENKTKVFTVTHANSKYFYVNDVQFFQRKPHYRGLGPDIQVVFVKQDVNANIFTQYGKFAEQVGDIQWQSVGSGVITLTAEHWSKSRDPKDLALSLVKAHGITGVDIRLLKSRGNEKSYVFRGAVK